MSLAGSANVINKRLDSGRLITVWCSLPLVVFDILLWIARVDVPEQRSESDGGWKRHGRDVIVFPVVLETWQRHQPCEYV